MSITGAYMVPHPPVIMAEVGRGEEKKIQKTIDAFTEVGRRIGNLRPDTIIVTSPHAHMYSNYFQISSGKNVHGDMKQFRARTVQFDKDYDTELVTHISELAYAKQFPAGKLGQQGDDLDHGTMVPLYFIEKFHKDYKLVRIGISGQPLEDHYRLGMLIKQASEDLCRNVVFIGSGDLSHKFSTESPYGFVTEGPEYDKLIMDVMGSGNFGKLFAFDSTFCEKAAECGHRSFIIMAGALDRTNIKAEILSHEGSFGIGYGVCAYEIRGDAPERNFLDQRLDAETARLKKQRSTEDEYVQLARKSVEAYVTSSRHISIPNDIPDEMTSTSAGAFVSIHEGGRLRGCIGTISAAQDCIAEEIISNAISAATKDTRFDPISPGELSAIEITVDILGEAEVIKGQESLDPGRYGVIVTKGGRRGLLLPNLDGIDTAEKQIAVAKRKAGIGEDEPGVKLERFEVVRHY